MRCSHRRTLVDFHFFLALFFVATFSLQESFSQATATSPPAVDYVGLQNSCISQHGTFRGEKSTVVAVKYNEGIAVTAEVDDKDFLAKHPSAEESEGPESIEERKGEVLDNMRAAVVACVARGPSLGSTNSANECTTARDSYNKFTSEFTDKCSKAGLTGGVLDCFIRARACTYCRNSNNTDGICGELANQEEGESFTDRLRKDSSGSTNSGSSRSDRKMTKARKDELANDERMFKICPSLAAKDAEAYSKKVERSEKKQETREEGLEKDQDRLDKLMAEKDEKLAKLKEDVETTKSRLESRIKALEEALKSNRDAIIAKVQEIRMQIDAMGAQMTKLTNDMTKAGIDLFSAKATMFARCHTESISKVTAIQNERSGLAKQGKLSAGSTKNLLKSLGKSHSQKMQQLVRAFNKDCTSDPAYQNAVKIAEASYNLAMTQISQERARIEAARTAAEGAIAALQASVPDLAAKHLKAVADATTEAYNAIEKLRLESVQVEQSYAVKIAQAQYKVFNTERAVAKFDAELDHQRNMLELRDQYTDGRSGPEAGTIPAMDALTLTSSVNGFVGPCCKGNPMQGTKEECDLAESITKKAGEIEKKMPAPSTK